MQSRYVVVLALLIGAAACLPTEASFDESWIPSHCRNDRPTVNSQCLDQSLSGHMLKYGHSLEAIKRGLCDAYIAHFECIAEFICLHCSDYTIPGKTEYETDYRNDLAAHLESPSCAGIKVNYSLEKSYCDYLARIEADYDVEDEEEEVVTTEMTTTMASETPSTLDDITTESATTMPTSTELDINNYLTTAAALPADHSKKSAQSAPVVGLLFRIVVLFVIPIAIFLLAALLIEYFSRKKQAEEVNEDIEMSKL